MFLPSYIAEYLFSSICLLNFVYFSYSIYKMDTRGLISCKEFQALEVSVIHTCIMAYRFSTDTRILNLYIPLCWNHIQTCHRRYEFTVQVKDSLQRPLPNDPTLITDIHAPSRTGNHNVSKRTAADPRLRQCSQWE